MSNWGQLQLLKYGGLASTVRVCGQQWCTKAVDLHPGDVLRSPHKERTSDTIAPQENY